MNVNWKYVTPLKNQNSIETFEAKYGVKFPEDLKEIFKQHNGGCPSAKYFDTASEQEQEFKSLLSFNEDDVENIYDFVFPDNKDVIPFATDPAGNLFCLYRNAIYYWQHETDRMEFLANSFSEFLGKLY